jgi:hypothetical protein
VQASCLEVLYFLDGLAGRRAREDMILSSAVSSGIITAVQAWPDFFGVDPAEFSSASSDNSGLELERATPESFAADMAALVRSSARVTLREPPEQHSPVPPGPQHSYVPDTEWT